MSSYEKVVKLACKPKAAPPKAKYLDPIISATYSEDGAIHDICKALSPRFREPNSIVVFKALIVLHSMIRNGATDNVLTYLTSTSDVLRLRNVSNGQWEGRTKLILDSALGNLIHRQFLSGYATPENLSNYALYLDARIRGYKELKHDVIRVQSESNRDLRVSSMEEEVKNASRSNVQRSKTIIGRKLRVMTVEKGLLRETKAVQKMVDTLIACRFYLDDLEDELTITALRMLVKDLLVLFQAGNEGVINVLEHYFEMSKIDATESLSLYRYFCKQTESVVDYLGIAKKLQNLLNVPIPNLRHAPVSLAGALEEYLNDPNFEQNRIEYKTQKAIADSQPLKSAMKRSKTSGVQAGVQATIPSASTSSQKPASKSDAIPVVPVSENVLKPDSQAMVDFFSSIEEAQPNMFNPQTNSPTSNYFNQQSTYNPFMILQGQQGQQVMAQVQATGFVPQPSPFAQIPQNQVLGQAHFASPFQQTQPTGIPPQSQPAPFLQMQQQQSAPFPQMQQQQLAIPAQMQQQQATLPPQSQSQHVTGVLQQPQPTGFLRPQNTGSNPFRQSMLLSQGTGFSPFAFGAGLPAGGGQSSPPFLSPNANMRPLQTQSAQGMSSNTNSPPPTFSPGMGTPFAMNNSISARNIANTGAASITRPASTPIVSKTTPSFGQSMTQVATHQTGSKNPFGQPKYDVPPVPKPPTLQELASGGGAFGRSGGGAGLFSQSEALPGGGGGQNNPFGVGFGGQPMGQNQVGQQQQQPFSSGGSGSVMASVASSFMGHQSQPASKVANTSTIDPQFTSTSTAFSDFTSLSFGSTATGASSATTAPSISLNVPITKVEPQATGFGGIKPFKPTSSFGASLLEALPPVPQGVAVNNSVGSGVSTGSTTSQSTPLSPFGALNSPPTGFTGQTPGQQQQSSGLGPNSNLGIGTGSTVGVGLRPQNTGAVSNPFRASMLLSSNTGSPFAGLSPPFTGGVSSSPSPFSVNQNSSGSLFPTGTTPLPGSSPFGSLNGTPSFGNNLFGTSQANSLNMNQSAGGGVGNGQKQQNTFTSLI